MDRIEYVEKQKPPKNPPKWYNPDINKICIRQCGRQLVTVLQFVRDHKALFKPGSTCRAMMLRDGRMMLKMTTIKLILNKQNIMTLQGYPYTKPDVTKMLKTAACFGLIKIYGKSISSPTRLPGRGKPDRCVCLCVKLHEPAMNE